ncbi:MAG: acyl-CoA thioesterase [Planctomycetales bacterium]|nr:acyl-CoA thioesterase [Planctomycetales bacterium]MCA9163713.1 acyl-CoA thioesterase [Planctomycetales bacterium]
MPIHSSSHSRPEAVADYPVAVRLPVQWGDQDAFGHVNNTVYLRWFETARIAYFEQSGMDPLMEQRQVGPILASATVHYRRQVTYPDHVWIGARVARMGTKSATMEHAVYSETEQRIAADGSCVVVAFDYGKNHSTPIPQELRDVIAAFEQREF